MDSDSDYSVVDSAEEEHTSSARQKKSGKAVQKSNYRIRNALKVPRATTYTAQALYDQIHSSDINLEPEYQRAVVWPEAKQIGIIDSIFRNFYIPPVIFCKPEIVTLGDGNLMETRCKRVRGWVRDKDLYRWEATVDVYTQDRFMDGLIPHKDPFTNEKLWYKDVGPLGKGTKSRKLLPDKYRRLFANKQIVCVEYQDITDTDEREIFQRVQLGMALTPAEKIQVISSPRAAFIRELQATYLQESGGLVGDSLEWDRSRGGDFRCLAQTVFTIEKYPSPTFTIAPLEKWLAQSDVVISKTFHDRIHQMYRVMLELVRDPHLNKPFRTPAKVAPIEFVFIGLLVAVHMDTLTLPQLSSAVGMMRDDVRRQHVDIRMNARVARTMVEFVQGIEPGKIPSVASGGEAAGVIVGRKRKREQEETEARIVVKKEVNETAGPSGLITKHHASSFAGQSTPASHSTTIATSTGAPALSSSHPASVDRLAAVRLAKQAVAPANQQVPHHGLRTPNITPTPTYQQQPAPRSLEESLMASMGLAGRGPPPPPPPPGGGRGDGRWEYERERNYPSGQPGFGSGHGGGLGPYGVHNSWSDQGGRGDMRFSR